MEDTKFPLPLLAKESLTRQLLPLKQFIWDICQNFCVRIFLLILKPARFLGQKLQVRIILYILTINFSLNIR